MHLTLKFLGSVADSGIARVCDAVAEVASRHGPFELDIEGVGCFGGKGARVLWVGAGTGSEELRRLRDDLETRLREDGWPAESRHFSGHLTLCRVKNYRAAAKVAEIGGRYRHWRVGCISVEAVKVYSSELRPEGPVYTPLAGFGLSGAT
jgi:2'-5' RNA ligase